LQKFELDPVQRLYFKRSALCKTLAGNRVDVLTITEDHPDESLEKAHIIISGRVHSGETVSSYVVNGILQFLMSNDERAHKLRQNFIFKIVPMLNPDGVIHGNYRSGVSGHDLNRKW
jgi:murein tripeptide amidase MpaA